MIDRRIVIIGFMGCGKTTVARALAARLDCESVDLDAFIANEQGRTAAEIIREDGEAAFREVETLALRTVLQNSKIRIIAMGGGAWTVPANRTLIALHDCLSVWLDAPFELCWSRIVTENTHRPLAPNREEAMKRYDSRCADYALADLRVAAPASMTAEQLARQILAI